MHANPTFTVLLIVIGLLALPACTPRIIVRANPGTNDTGIRYYRPKPYLKVEPAEVAVDKNRTEVAPGLVRISLAYLPDFSEEYSIDVRSGFGTADVGIKLDDGWNLTEISQDLDSQTDENLKAIGSILIAVGDVVPTSGRNTQKTADHAFTVAARNVPIGFYESVIGRDSHGCKRLYGFRYLGFMPYSSCPVNMGGQQSACCGDPTNPMFGLTFVDGQMVFQSLDEMAVSPIQGDVDDTDAVSTSSRRNGTEQAPVPSLEIDLIDIDQLAIRLRAYLRELGLEALEVHTSKSNEHVVVRIDSVSSVGALSLRKATDDWIEETFGSTQLFDVQIE